ncbi:hypothetical protein FY550_10345 [Kushneria phosphatilytica]|uniref:Uncharacterized protein n=1 Tax=Kushneria phosphatilytica TaxID=657387 RepID=A0A5C1A024_9GAMM|nr:hypothetical protein [Kushneria phosphatilytica]QEL11496.1 hypothetical protein FY550_10345 [Kushneria phosphatilytica]
MARNSTLSIKEKWALDNQLGEMLRGLDNRPDTEEHLRQALKRLLSDYEMSVADTVELLNRMRQETDAA